jgi:hypothetical protein
LIHAVWQEGDPKDALDATLWTTSVVANRGQVMARKRDIIPRPDVFRQSTAGVFRDVSAPDPLRPAGA